MRNYRHRDWLQFRQQVLELDGSACVKCGRRGDGVVLQVHHKKYNLGQLPWEHPLDLCETLCSGCHAAEHGKIRPTHGWSCVGFDDLGDLSGECELCGTSFRYAFFIEHPKWSPMEVGTDCCDHLTGNTEASTYMKGLRSTSDRRKRFVSSKRWMSREGGESITQAGIIITVARKPDAYGLVVDGFEGKQEFTSPAAAKSFVFGLINSGELLDFVKRKRRQAQLARRSYAPNR